MTNLSHFFSPYDPKGNKTKIAIINSYLDFFRVYFNADANGMEFKPFDYTLTHWVSNQGDDLVVKINPDQKRKGFESIRKLKVIRHTLPIAEWTKKDLGLDKSDGVNTIDNLTDDNSNDLVARKVRNGVMKINPIVFQGTKLNRAKVIASFFVPNPDDLPFVAVIDGDVNNLAAKNLYWSERNMFPILNMTYEQEDMNTDVVIHTPSIRALKENMNLYGWPKVYTKVNVPIPNDLFQFFKQWKIAIPSAVFTALRFISQWSFCVFAVEHPEARKVWIGYTPALDGVYVDQIFKVASEVKYFNEVIFSEGHGVLKLNYLTLAQTRTSAHDSCVHFMNKYHNMGWEILNTDFYHPSIQRDITLSMKLSELEELDKKLLEEKGVDLQTYLQAVVKKLNRQ